MPGFSMQQHTSRLPVSDDQVSMPSAADATGFIEVS